MEIARRATFEPEEWEAYERAKMAEQDARGALVVAHQEGELAGKIAAKAAAILAVLAARGIAVSEEARTRIMACREASTLDRWIARAATAVSADEVIENAPEPA